MCSSLNAHDFSVIIYYYNTTKYYNDNTCVERLWRQKRIDYSTAVPNALYRGIRKYGCGGGGGKKEHDRRVHDA